MAKGKIILLNGASSSGKSTLIQKFVELMPDYLKLSLDDIGGLIFGMRNQRGKPTTSEIAVQSNYSLFLKPYLLPRIIRLIHDYSYNIIVDTVIDNKDVLEDWQSLFSEGEIVFVAVVCPLDELVEREKLRGDRTVGLAKSQFENIHAGIKYDIEVNTANSTIDECVNKIIDFINAT